MKRFAAWATLALYSASLAFPLTAIAEDSQVVDPQELSLEAAKKGDGAYSVVEYEDGRPVVARSIARTGAFADGKTPPKDAIDIELSDKAKKVVRTAWLINPDVGGAVSKQNTVLLTPEAEQAVEEVTTHVADYMAKHTNLYLDLQVVPVYHGLEDVVPTYVFIGFRALEDDGRPVTIPLWDIKNPLLGYIFEGGSAYHYLAVSNESDTTALNYSTGEPSRKPKHDGFQQPFEPADYFGSASEEVNDETAAEIDEDNLPPGSRPVFLNNGVSGINGLQVGTSQANGEGTGAFGGKLFAIAMPFLLMGSVLLIAMGSK